LIAESRIDGTISTSVSAEAAGCGDFSDCVIDAEVTMEKLYDSQCFERAYFEMNPANSDYVLPYPTGKAYRLSQTYCGPTSGHHNQLAFDFLMQIGDEVVAARSGVVRALREDSPDDGQGSRHNHVMIEHTDGTVGFYAHLKQAGVLVGVDDDVTAGQLIAYAGHSGTTDVPHLHFGVYQDYPPIEGQDVPITFRNAPGPIDCRGGLIPGETYQAVTD
jgi:murein DD-endopeptidase MepM/ murein hydrolase activator NlpD